MKKRSIWILLLFLMVLPIKVQAKSLNLENTVISVSINQNYMLQKIYEIKKFADDETISVECNGIFDGEFGKILKEILDLVKFVVPVLIIGLSIIDYMKALVAQKPEEIKKATQRLVKRIIIGVLIFVLPTILEFVLDLASIGMCKVG